MKSLLFFMLIAIAFIACKKETTHNALIGKWKWIEFQSPGLGSGPPPPVPVTGDSIKYIEFKTNWQYRETRKDTLLCSGTYKLIKDTLLLHTDCFPDWDKNIIFLQGDTLTIMPIWCQEGCGYSKYVKAGK